MKSHYSYLMLALKPSIVQCFIRLDSGNLYRICNKRSCFRL